MRLYNTYHVCKMAMEDLKYVEISDVSTRRDALKETSIINFRKFLSALEKLSCLEFLKDDVQKAIDSTATLLPGRRGAIIRSDSDKERIVSSLNTIVNKVQATVDLYESLKEVNPQMGIDIYVPPCKYLKEYMGILKEIDFIVGQCPYLRSDNEEIQYDGTDIGSDWITLVIVVTGAVTSASYILNNFAELTKKVQEIRTRFQMIKQNEEFLKTLNAKNELINELQEVYDKAKEEAFSKATAELKQSLGNLNDGEEEGKVLMSLKKYNDLLDMGVRFYSSIDSPPEIKELLPSSDDSKALTDTIVKYIENKDDRN